MNETRTTCKDKNQHIQVFVRVRPLSISEKSGKTIPVVELPSSKEIIIYERPQDKISKKFTYDKVFGPLSKQIDIYNAVVSPMLEEVLAGYNCTVFAYGQTGTGKTYTMEGVSNDPTLHWQSDTTAGMIPRSLSHLFDELRLLEAQEYSVRVSFLELYNEELFDLLSANDDASKIRLFEDASKKGAVIIHGLEEVTVHNKSEVYKILEKGSKKRQTAATLMNAHSSRSHTVFSITVHIKENTIDGEELLKTGKLNLVDLAGSENVGRSGAVDRRAREAGNINQSLLTLGRVITALVERAPHIPYRESKLTRLLQESLGGRTKTSIIATISPASINLEETLSTLDYAHRAKNITNRPEINQKLSKKALLKEYTEEIERLRRDLLATRERNGVYLAHDNYTEMQALIECQGKEIEEKINHIKALEETMQNKEIIFNELQSQHYEQTNELHKKKDELEKVTHVLKSTKDQLQTTERDRDEQNHLVGKHVSTEKTLLSQAQTLLNVADTAIADTHKLHDKICRKTQVEQENENLTQRFRTDIAKRLQFVETDLSTYTEQFDQFCTSMRQQIDTQIAIQSQNIDTTVDKFAKEFFNQHLDTTNKLEENINKSYAGYQKWLEEEMRNVSSITEHECNMLSSVSMKLAPRIEKLVQNTIAENIRILHDDISQRLANLSAHTKEAIDSIYDYRLKDRDRICENVKNIKENVQSFLDKQNTVLEKRHCFAMMMEDLSRQFNELYKTENDHCYNAINTFHQVNKMCNDINAQTLDGYSLDTERQRNLGETIQSNIQQIKSDVNSGTQKTKATADGIIEQSKVLVSEIQKDLSTNRDELMKYKNHVYCNIKELQGRLEQDQNKMLTSVHDIQKLVSDTTANHVESLGRQKTEAINACTEIRTALENQNVQSTDWNNRISSQLHATHHQVDKFFVEDMRHDIPTGTTPAKREFFYPRKFTVTSPHERIIRRFREMRKEVETPDDNTYVSSTDETVLYGDTTIKHISASNTLAEITVTSPELANVKTSTPNSSRNIKRSNSQPPINGSIMKSASGSDLSRVSISSIVHSDSDIYIKVDDKENGGDEFLKPEKAKNKKLTKVKKQKETKRRVLGTYN